MRSLLNGEVSTVLRLLILSLSWSRALKGSAGVSSWRGFNDSRKSIKENCLTFDLRRVRFGSGSGRFDPHRQTFKTDEWRSLALRLEKW
jgi:hypothetical protein